MKRPPENSDLLSKVSEELWRSACSRPTQLMMDDDLPRALELALLNGFEVSVDGFEVPDDLPLISLYIAKHHQYRIDNVVTYHPELVDKCCGSIDDAKYMATMFAFMKAVRTGFTMALMVYEDELKRVPHATSVLRAMEKRSDTSRKNGKVRSEMAAPTHKAIQKRFRELRKSSPKKTVRYRRVAEEFGMSDRQVARIVTGIN